MLRPAIVRRILLAATTVLFVTAPALAQNRMFLLIPTIPGESTDPTHAGWIDAYSFSEGLSRAGAAPSFQDVSLLKAVDIATPALHSACAAGAILGTVQIEICPSAGGACSYKIQLDSTIVTSVAGAGSSCIAPGACGPSEAESVTLSYTRIRWTYTPVGGTSKTSCWDRALNKAC